MEISIRRTVIFTILILAMLLEACSGGGEDAHNSTYGKPAHRIASRASC